MIERFNATISGSDNKPMLADVSHPSDTSAIKGYIIFVHGYKGFKDWGAWNLVAEHFASAGFCFVKFNFSHNGTSPEQPTDFVNLEAFGNNNYSKECNDLNTVIDWVLHSDRFPKSQKEITIIGHSRGGGIAVLVTARHPAVSRVITWASLDDFGKRFPQGTDLEEWKNRGVYHVMNGRTGQQMPHRYQWYEDYLEHVDLQDIKWHALLCKKPAMVIHAIDDESVHVSAAMRLKKWFQNSSILLIDSGGHTFGSSHPWNEDGLPSSLENICNRSIQFIVR